MKIQVRFAESGHSYTFQKQSTINGLMQTLKNQYKIQCNDQKLISKSGYLFHCEDNLQSLDSLMQMTYVAEQNQNISMNTIPSVYLFNDKSLYLVNDCKYQPTQKQCNQVLETRKKCFQKLQQTIYELSFLTLQEQEQLKIHNPKIHTLAQKIHQQYNNLANLSSQFSTIKYYVQEIIHLCDNQRKSVTTLNRCLSGLYDGPSKKKYNDIISKINSTKQIFEKIPKKQKYLSNKFENLQKKIQQFQNNRQQYYRKIKQQRRRYKDKFKISDQQLKEIDQRSLHLEQKVKNILEEIKIKYTNIAQNLKKFVWGENSTINLQGLDFNQQIINQKKNELISYIQQQKDNFMKLYQKNKKNQFQVRDCYRSFNAVYVDMLNQDKEIKKVQKDLNVIIKDIDNINSGNQRQNSQDSINQVKKRLKFKIQFENLIKKLENLRVEQQNRRKKYKQSKVLKGSSEQIEELNTLGVPRINIDYKNTTDHNLQKYQVQQNISLQNQQENVLKQLEYMNDIVKQFVNSKQQPQKIKNIQNLLQKSSKIFFDIYQHKIQQEKFKYKSLEKSIKDKLYQNNILKIEVNNLQEKLTELQNINILQENNIQQIHQELVEKQSQIQIQDKSISQLHNQIRNLEIKFDDKDNQLKSKNFELENFKKDINLLKQNLLKQITINQSITSEIQNIEKHYEAKDSEIQMMKIQLKNKQIEIQQIKEQIKILRIKFQTENTYKNETKKDETDRQIQLNAQIQFLQEQVERLQNQIKMIILKETEDQQIQVNQLQNHFEISQQDRISIQSIKQGQKCLFLPFGNSIYVGLSNQNNCKTNYVSQILDDQLYIFDFKNLPKKGQQLLNEYSLVLIVNIERISFQDRIHIVSGKVQYALGFEDEEKNIKNYANFIYD